MLRRGDGNIPWAGRGCSPSWKMDQSSSSDLMAGAQEQELKQFYPELGPGPGDRVHCRRGRGKAIWDSVIVALGAIWVDATSMIHPCHCPSPCLQHIWDFDISRCLSIAGQGCVAGVVLLDPKGAGRAGWGWLLEHSATLSRSFQVKPACRASLCSSTRCSSSLNKDPI